MPESHIYLQIFLKASLFFLQEWNLFRTELSSIGLRGLVTGLESLGLSLSLLFPLLEGLL
jgi:hypothetical protein